MKRTILLIMAIVLCAFSVHAAETKIGYVDLNKALNESEEGKKAVKILEEMFKSKQAIIDEKRKELGKLTEDLQKQSSVLTQEAIKEKQDERDRLAKDFQRIVKDSEEEVEKKRADFMDRILRDIAEIIRKTGVEEGFTVIFEKAQGGIMYIQDKLDLTDKIIKKYNDASKSKK